MVGGKHVAESFVSWSEGSQELQERGGGDWYGLLKPKRLLLVAHVFQQGHTSRSFPNTSINQEPSIQTHEPMWKLPYSDQLHSLNLVTRPSCWKTVLHMCYEKRCWDQAEPSLHCNAVIGNLPGLFEPPFPKLKKSHGMELDKSYKNFSQCSQCNSTTIVYKKVHGFLFCTCSAHVLCMFCASPQQHICAGHSAQVNRLNFWTTMQPYQ